MTRQLILLRFLVLSLWLLALIMAGCQTFEGYSAVCQSDDDCAGYQQCQVANGVCLLRDGYDPCDPDKAFDDCPVATSCDEEARVCLPRKMRIARYFSFRSPRYERRQYANLLKDIVPLVSTNYFADVECGETSTEEQEAYIVYRCENARIEFLFVDSGNDPDLTLQRDRLAQAYALRPFDVVLPFFSSNYAGAVDFSEQNELDLLILGRTNKRADRVSVEFEPDYMPPPLLERYDLSLVAYNPERALADYLSDDEHLGCASPLMVYEDDNEPYLLARRLHTGEWARQGVCLDYETVPKDALRDYTALLSFIDEQDIDCVWTYQFNNTRVSDLLNEYAVQLGPGERSPVTWIMRRRIVEESGESAKPLRDLLKTSRYNDATRFIGTTPLAQSYGSFRERVEPQYSELLLERGCLSTPKVGCEELACQSGSKDVQVACENIRCPVRDETLTCLELGCLGDDRLPFCDLLGCEETSISCDYFSPKLFDTESIDVASVADQVIVSWLLSLVHGATEQKDRPLSREELRDALHGMADPSHTICAIPDTVACQRLIEQREDFHYTGLLTPFIFDAYGRAQRSERQFNVYKVNSNLEFVLSKGYDVSEQAALDALAEDNITPAVCPARE